MVLFCLAEVSLHIILCADVWSLGEAFLRITAKPNTVIFLKCHILCAPLNQVTLLITFPLTTSSKGEKYPKELIPAGKALGFSVATILCFSLSFFFLFLDLPRTLLILNSWLALEVRAWWWGTFRKHYFQEVESLQTTQFIDWNAAGELLDWGRYSKELTWDLCPRFGLTMFQVCDLGQVLSFLLFVKMGSDHH